MNQNTFHPTATRIEIKFIEMKNLTLTALALIVLATACNEPKPLNYSVKQSLLTKKEYSLSLCGDKNDCIVTYAWYSKNYYMTPPHALKAIIILLAMAFCKEHYKD